MAKWFGKIGFSNSYNDGDGIWKNEIIEKEYYGNLNKSFITMQNSSDKVIDDITMSNELSIIADLYANKNYHSIKYAEIMGVKWRVSKIDIVEYPRLKLTFGGIYNG